MTQKRWTELMNNVYGRLTDAELADGWHWCMDWDSLLVGPGMMEMDCCTCVGVNKAKHVSPTLVTEALEGIDF